MGRVRFEKRRTANAASADPAPGAAETQLLAQGRGEATSASPQPPKKKKEGCQLSTLHDNFQKMSQALNLPRFVGYPEEIKNEALERVRTGETQAQVCREMGILEPTLSRWVTAEKARHLQGSGELTLADKLESIADFCADNLRKELKGASVRELTGTMDYSIKNMLLLRGQPTNITENREIDARAVLEALRDALGPPPIDVSPEPE